MKMKKSVFDEKSIKEKMRNKLVFIGYLLKYNLKSVVEVRQFLRNSIGSNWVL